jgi:hypothetical protein
MHIVNELRNCALKLVNEISIYYGARSEKHQNMIELILSFCIYVKVFVYRIEGMSI